MDRQTAKREDHNKHEELDVRHEYLAEWKREGKAGREGKWCREDGRGGKDTVKAQENNKERVPDISLPELDIWAIGFDDVESESVARTETDSLSFLIISAGNIRGKSKEGGEERGEKGLWWREERWMGLGSVNIFFSFSQNKTIHRHTFRE